MKIAYGHQIESDSDEYIKMTENVSLAHVDAGDPGTAPVDFFPIRMWYFLQHVSTADHLPQSNTYLGGSRDAGSTALYTVRPASP